MRCEIVMCWIPLVALLLTGCPTDEPMKTPFVDTFDRAELGGNYNNTGGPYRIVDNKLTIKGAYNHPLWLRKKLPRNAVIELDVMTKSASGDIKVEAWGDGQYYSAKKGAYLATSYVFIFGGWHNSKSVLARMDEHAPDIKARTEPKVVPNKVYHWKIKRQGSKIEWFIDGKAFLELDDPNPLEGDGHSHFGFNNWEVELVLDNLKITPL